MRLSLTILAGQRSGAKLYVDPPGGNIGRAPESAVLLPDASVSRQHAELRWNGDAWMLRSLSSSSPTAVDGKLVLGTEVRLAPSGQLGLGIVLIQYSTEQSVTKTALAAHAERGLLAQLPPLPVEVLKQLEPLSAAQAAPTSHSVHSARDGSSPPTLIRRPAPNAASEPPTAPPTLLLSRVRPSPHPQSDSPPTLIRPKAPPPMEAPPTLIRSPQAAAVPSAASAPETIIRLSPVAGRQTATVPAATSPEIPQPVVEHAAPVPSLPVTSSSERVNRELQQECDHLKAALSQLQEENERLRAAQEQLQSELAALRAQPVPSPVPSEPPEPDLRTDPTTLPSSAAAAALIEQLGSLLEGASEAMRAGDSVQARSLVREASFVLADFRDLCTSASTR